MNILIVYDFYMRFEKINASPLNTKEIFYLFPLTSRSCVTNAVTAELRDLRYNFEIVNTAEMVNLAANNLRDKYIQFIAEFPSKVKKKGLDIKKFFAIDKHATLWWFGLISEKHPYKSNAFNKIAQLESIVTTVKQKNITKIIFWCRDDVLKGALSEYARLNFIEFEVFPSNWAHAFKSCILRFQKMYYLKHIFMLINFIMRYSLRIWRVKKEIRASNRTLNFLKRKLLLITPYPNIDLSLAKKGIFKNRFYGDLQDALKSEKEDIVWVAMYIENNSLSFRESLKCARQFINRGYSIFFLEEFNSFSIQIKALWLMLKTGLKYIMIEKDVASFHTFGEYNFYKILKEDWYLSFVSSTGYLELLYYFSFKSMLNKIKAGKCLYLCEMHAWEKALL